jgi:hypothetical protein
MKKNSSKRNWNSKRKLSPLVSAQPGILFISIAILLSACGGQDGALTPQYFIAPSVQPSSQPVAFVTPTSLLPTPTGTCEDGLEFVEDVTIPDGAQFAPGAEMEKIWLVRNTGSCNWEAGYRLRLISGPAMGVEPDQALFPARSGSEAEIRIVFTAPDELGVHRSSWQAFNLLGDPFGDLFFIEVEVDASLGAPQETAAPAQEGE